MPKVLNVVKLHKKFASLTRSKESIQSLGGWIMHHSEFHEDIVNEWLVGLSKDYNALVMFYVANEVIQNCGKKRVPEFREDFAKVLKKAVSLEKVKVIKDNVIRLISFWRERDIYDEKFSQELQTILNSNEIKVDSDEEPSEEEVIARFKKENLIADLEKLKVAIADRGEKEDILKYADEPVKPDSSVSLLQRECQDMIEKCEKYLKLVEETINLTCREVRVKKTVLEDLKDCCIFYSAQSRDVKEVASMFRIYGRKLKIMEKKVSEKKASFSNTESNLSPSLAGEMLSSPYSVSSYASLSDNDSTSVFERISKVSQDSPGRTSQETDNKMQKSFFALLNTDKNTDSNSLLSEGLIPDPGLEKLKGNSLNSDDTIKELDSNASCSKEDNPTEKKLNPVDNKGDLNDIDFLLDESYDCKKGNPKPVLKRKAEIRLKLKEKRVCTEKTRESININPVMDEPFKITPDENPVKSKTGDFKNMNITVKDVGLEISTIDVKGNDSVLSESLLDKSETVLNNEPPIKKDDVSDSTLILETPLQKNQISELSNEKIDKNDSVMILETPLQRDETVFKNEYTSKKAEENDCVMIPEDKSSNKKDEEGDCSIISKTPLVEDTTVLNVEPLNKKPDEGSSSILPTKSTHTEACLSSSDKSKDDFESTEPEERLSSTTQKEIASDSVPNVIDDPIGNKDKMETKPSFENCVIPAETPQCSETLNIQTQNDSSVTLKTEHFPKDELNGDSPNLLENLQKVLDCICNKQFMRLQASDSGIEPLAPLENYIAIYGALCCPVKDLTEGNVLPPLQTGSSIIRQNEVVDMECETDEES